MPLASVRIDSRFAGPERRAVSRAAANAAVMGAPGHPASDLEAPRVVVEAALSRVLESRTFRQSERHREFLRYVVVAALDGRARILKEVVIGLEVFKRDLDGYDPRRDSIVRVEARRLRRKLERYYAAEGRREAIEIRLEPGGYVPTFVARGTPRDQAVARAPLFVVLPCRAGAEDAGVSRGLADQLIDRLGSLAGVKVLTPLAVAPWCGADVALDAMRRDHGVHYVVDGSITRIGDRLRCVLRLSRTDDGVQRWSGVFDFDPAPAGAGTDLDVFAFQDRIVDAVSEAARVEREARD